MYVPSIDEIESLLAFIKAHNLFVPSYFWKLTPVQIQKIYNGIGPDAEPSWIARRLTDALHWAAAAALIHDIRYEFGDGTKADWHDANEQFRANEDLSISVKNLHGLELVEREALHLEADGLYEAVETPIGWSSYQAAHARGPAVPMPA